MTKVTQKGNAGHIHRLFHALAKKHGIDVDKVAGIIWDWEDFPKKYKKVKND